MNKRLKILLLTEYYPPEIGAGSIRAHEFARRWSDKADITVLTALPNYPTGIIPEEYKGRFFVKEEKENYTLLRTFIIPASNTGFTKRLLSYVSFMFSSVIQGIFFIGKQDIIIASSPPLFIGISTYMLSKFKRIPFIFELRDLWPDILIEMGHLNNKLIINIFKKIEFFLYRKALHIVTVSPRVKEIINNRGISVSKISVITNGVNLKFFNPGIDIKGRMDHNFNDKFIVSYIGTLAYQYGLDTILETARLMIERLDILFLFVGEGPQKNELNQRVKNKNLTNVMLKDAVPLDEVRNYYSQSDVVLVPLRNLPLLESTIPVKLLESMAMEIPVIINANGVSRDIMEAGKAGLYAEPDNPQVLMKKILYLYDSPEIRKEMGRKGRQHIVKKYDREKLSQEYLGLIHSLLN
jgi:glycosyltransferase involved in cell wall biosynthesis